MSKTDNYIIDKHNNEYKKLGKLDKVWQWYYRYKFLNYDFEILSCNDHWPKTEWVLDVIENWTHKYSLYHNTMKECKMQLEVMINNPHLLD